jgi:hypothetical protein
MPLHGALPCSSRIEPVMGPVDARLVISWLFGAYYSNEDWWWYALQPFVHALSVACTAGWMICFWFGLVMQWEGDGGVSNWARDNPGPDDGSKLPGHLRCRKLRDQLLLQLRCIMNGWNKVNYPNLIVFTSNIHQMGFFFSCLTRCCVTKECKHGMRRKMCASSFLIAVCNSSRAIASRCMRARNFAGRQRI